MTKQPDVQIGVRIWTRLVAILRPRAARTWRGARGLVDGSDVAAVLYSLVLAARVLAGAAVLGFAIRIFLATSGFGGQ